MSHRWLITGLLKESNLWISVQPTLNARKKAKSKSPSQVKSCTVKSDIMGKQEPLKKELVNRLCCKHMKVITERGG